MTRLITAFLISIPLGLFSQNYIIDSIKNDLNHASADSSIIKYSLRLAYNMKSINHDSSLLLTQEAHEHIKNLRDEKVQITAMRRVGHAYYTFKKIDEALLLFEQAIAIARNINHEEEISYLLNNLGSAYRAKKDFDQAIDFYQQSLTMNQEREDKGGQIVALNNLGAIFKEDLEDYDQAIVYYNQALESVKSTNNKVYQAAILYNIAGAYNKKGNYQKTLAYYESSLHLYQELKDPANQGRLHKVIASVHQNHGNSVDAFENYQKKLGIELGLGQKTKAGYTLRAISSMYRSFGDYPISIKFLNQEVDIWKELDRTSSLATAYNNLGYTLILKGAYDSARVHLKKSLQLAQEIGNEKKIALATYNMGSSYEKTNRLDSAEIYLQKALFLAEKYNNIYLQTLSLTDLAHIDQKRGKPEPALLKRLKAYNLSPPLHLPKQKLVLAEELYAYYKRKKEPNLALQYLENFMFFKDSLYNIENTRKITQMGAEYEFQREKQKLELEQAQKSRIQDSFQRNILMGLGVSILFILILTWFYFSKQKANRKLRRLNEEILQQKTLAEQQNHRLKTTQNQLVQSEKMASLGQLTAGIAHEIKNPLNFVNNFAQFSQDLALELQEGLGKHLDKLGEEDANTFESILNDLQLNTAQINQHGQRADNIVQSMMNHASGAKGERKKLDINQLLKESTSLAFKGYKVGKDAMDIDISLNLKDKLPPCSVVGTELSRVVVNLFNNSCDSVLQKQKSAGPDYHPQIIIHTQELSDQVEIRFRDNGMGIPTEIRGKIFEPFYTSKPTGLGNTGLGLSISHDIIVQGHNGSIRVNSEEGKFTEFIIHLPL